MDDIAPALLENIRAAFLANLKKSARAAELLRQIEAGTAGYAQAGDYAYEIGSALAEAFRSELSAAVLPGGRMYQNIAEKVVAPLLGENHDLVSSAAAQVQQALNEAAGIGLKAQAAPLDTDRVQGIVRKVTNSASFDDAAWALDEPVKTFSQAVVDDTLKRNAEFQSKAGLRPRIVRRAEFRCCEWCSRMEGIYTYPDVPKDVYRRHERCRCVVEYNPGSGKMRQDVWSKKWTSEKESDTINSRKTVGFIPTMPGFEKAVIADEKVSFFFLKQNGKHSADFFDVGYTENDGELLKADLRRGIAMNPAKLSKASTEDIPKYIVDMQLGITKHRTFRTVWWLDSPEGPRLITAHRIGGDKDV